MTDINSVSVRPKSAVIGAKSEQTPRDTMEYYVKNKLSRSRPGSSRRNSAECRETLNEVHEIMRCVSDDVTRS